MIKSKKCKECDRPAFSKGLCKIHIPKTKIKTSGKQANTKRDIYFETLIGLCEYSEFSGIKIEKPSRSNIAHILPKRNHKSVEDNLNNYLFLTFSEHERFDYLLFSHSFEKLEEEFEKIIPILKQRLDLILPLCEETTPLKIAIEKWINK